MGRAALNFDKTQFKRVPSFFVPIDLHEWLQAQANRRANDEGAYVPVSRMIVEHLRRLMSRLRKLQENGNHHIRKKGKAARV